MAERPPSDSDARDSPGNGDRSPDRAAVRAVLERHPVRLGVLFGSHATGVADARSDVDLLVEPDPGTDRRAVVLDLLTDLSVELGRDDFDVALVGDVDPRVGRAALEHGELLLGSPERADELRGRFDREVDPVTREGLRERFDAVLERVDAAVGTEE